MKKILLLVASILALLLVADRLATRGLDYLYERNFWGASGGQLNNYLKNVETPELLIIGDSRAHRHLIPDSFACRTFSLCHHGMDFLYHAGVLHVLETEGKLPKKIILHLEHAQFSVPEGMQPETRDIQHLRYFHGKNEYITRKINELDKGERFLYLFDGYRYNGKVSSLVKNYLASRQRQPDNSLLGFEALPPESMDSIRVVREVEQNDRLKWNEKNFVVPASSVAVMEEIISLCQRNGVELTCFISPFFFQPPPRYRFAAAFLEDFFQKKGIPFLDFSMNRPPIYDRMRLWRDAYHLNLDGARVFTNQFKNQIKITCQQ